MEVLEEVESEIMDKATDQNIRADDKEMDDVKHLIENDPFFSGSGNNVDICRRVLCAPMLAGGSVRLVDLFYLVGGLAFLVFLVVRRRATKAKLDASDSPSLSCVKSLIVAVSRASAARSALALLLTMLSADESSVLDRVMWVTTRAIFLGAEVVVPVLTTMAGAMDARGLGAVQRMVLVSLAVSLVYGSAMFIMEFW